MKDNRRNRKLSWIRERNKFRSGKIYKNFFVVSDQFLSEQKAESFIKKFVADEWYSLMKKYRIALKVIDLSAGKIVTDLRNDYIEDTTTILFCISI